jgi:RNA polymerase sigma-70 factor (ECF subfamily)
MIEDKLLILRFKQGRNGALRQIYDKYKVELLKFSVVLTGDVNAAEDMVHDVFVKFAQSAEGIRLTGSLKNYLITSIINRVRNYRRDNIRHCEAPLDQADLIASPKRGPLQWAVLSERLELLSNALQELPYEQREVVSLRMETDLPFRRIARLQRVSINTVKGRYRYGINKLRSLLDSEVDK